MWLESIRTEVLVDDLLLTLAPADVEAMLARRLREARKAKGWTQAELALRSGLSVPTVARLEQSGQGQVSSLVRLCAGLGRLDEFDALLRAAPPATLGELRQLHGRKGSR